MSEENKVDASRDFSTLMFVGKINSFFGWIMVAGCVVAFFVGLIAGADKSGFYFYSLFGVMLIPISLLVVASGQMISCLVSTERNSKDTSEILKKILDKMEDKPIQQEENQ